MISEISWACGHLDPELLLAFIQSKDKHDIQGFPESLTSIIP